MEHHRMVYKEKPEALNHIESVFRYLLVIGFFVVLAVEAWMLIQVVVTMP